MEDDRYIVTLVCVACGAEAEAERWHRHDPYPSHEYRCPPCVDGTRR